METLALANLNTEPGVGVALVISVDDEDALLVANDGTICANTVCCCEISGAAKRENIATTTAIDGFNIRVFFFVFLREVINSNHNLVVLMMFLQPFKFHFNHLTYG